MESFIDHYIMDKILSFINELYDSMSFFDLKEEDEEFVENYINNKFRKIK